MEGRVPWGLYAGPESTERSRRPSAGTRAYPHPQGLTPVQFSPITTGAYKHYCGTFQRHRDRHLPQPQQDKQQHHQHRWEPQQQVIILECRQEFQPHYVRPTPSLLPQPVEHGINQAHFGQAPYNEFHLPLRDPRRRTWSRLALGDSGSAAVVASLAASPGVAPPKKQPLQGVLPGGPGQALARGSSSPHEHPSMPLWPWSQVTPSHPVTGAEVQKQFAVPLKEDRSRKPQGEEGSSRYGPPNQDLVQCITKTDKDIPQVESSSDEQKEKQNELQASSSAGGGNDREDAARLKPKLPSLSERIYSENRDKAHRSHAVLDHIGRKLDQPLYREPSDTAVYHENKEKFKEFKKHLMIHIQKPSQEDKERDELESTKHDRLMKTSNKEIEAKQNSAVCKAKGQNLRDIFEKEFPELKRERQECERFLRASNRANSDAQMKDIIQKLQKQDDADRKMRQNAAVVLHRMDFQKLQRQPQYCDNSRLVQEIVAEHSERHILSTWTDQEKEIFRQKFIQFPKEFGKISSFLEKKTVPDCVRYYYMTKKTEKYKQLLRKSRGRDRSKKNSCGKRSLQN